jgi:hypothetical protein
MYNNKYKSIVSAKINVRECRNILTVKSTKVWSKHYVNEATINIIQDNCVLVNTTGTA